MFDWELILIFAVLGALLGSFANVLIHRLPEGLSIVLPRSHCLSCRQAVKWFHLIPIFSFLILRGRCAHCGAKISFRYFIVEVLMAYLFALCVHRYGVSFTSIEYLIFIFGVITASFIDLDHMLLPDKITYPGMILALAGAALNPERHFIDSVLGLVAGGGSLWLVAYFYFLWRKEEGLGGGDIKLMAWVGALLGWQSVAFVVMTGSLVGAVFGLALSLGSSKSLKTAIPFGPYLALGALLFIFGGSHLSSLYLSLFFLQP